MIDCVMQEPTYFDEEYVSQQLVHWGVTAAIQVCAQGYPDVEPINPFIERCLHLIPMEHRPK